MVKLKLGKIKEKVRKLPTDYNKLSPMEKAEVRERYIKLQKGKCWYCKALLANLPTKKVQKLTKDFHPKFFIYQTHLHHDHETNLTVGVVHSRCNMVLWVYHGE